MGYLQMTDELKGKVAGPLGKVGRLGRSHRSRRVDLNVRDLR